MQLKINVFNFWKKPPTLLEISERSISWSSIFLCEFALILLCYFILKICSKIFIVIKYVGFTPVVPKPPDASVLPVSKGLSDA